MKEGRPHSDLVFEAITTQSRPQTMNITRTSVPSLYSKNHWCQSQCWKQNRPKLIKTKLSGVVPLALNLSVEVVVLLLQS